MKREDFKFTLQGPPSDWNPTGIVLEHGQTGQYDCHVIGDPCIVWDEAQQRYRMYYFAQNHTEDGREINQNALALSKSKTEVGAGDWRKVGLLEYTNREVIGDNGHKAFVVLDPYRPNVPARINDRYWHFLAVYRGYNKVIMVAKAKKLDGPWTLQEEPVLELGETDTFDGYNCDSPTAYWFASENRILLFYKGYPRTPQPDQPLSPLGSTAAAALMSPTEFIAQKQGKITQLPPDEKHWAKGWMSTPQIFKAAQGGWYGIANASSETPAPVEEEPAMREPAPSRGGWLYTPEEFPTKGWRFFDRPFSWIEASQKAGEGDSWWKHGVLVQEDGSFYLYYHAGCYGHEFLYGQKTQIKL